MLDLSAESIAVENDDVGANKETSAVGHHVENVTENKVHGINFQRFISNKNLFSA